MAFLKTIDPKGICADFPATLAYTYPYPLDPFQQHAVAAIHREENVLVTAKTGSGKTLVGEYQIHYSLAKGRRVFYTTPIKSLSNQKFHDLKKIFPSVGILTGDIKFKPDAQVVIMTTEILRNMLYKRKASTASLGISSNISLDDLDAVVFDEVHYINNPQRGKVWEETLILLPPEIRLILLSATLSAPEAFATWIGDLKQKPCVLISTLYRIVPLTHYVLRGDEMVCIMDAKDKYEDSMYRGWLNWRDGVQGASDKFKQKVKDARAGGTEGAIDGKVVVESFLHQMNSTINMLSEKSLLPALFFVFSRKQCEQYAKKIESTLIDSSDAAAVKHIIEFHLHRYESVKNTYQYTVISELLMRGIAYHHSGLMPLLKEIIEILFARGLVKVLFCTETFAVGINMPTKTAVFLDYHKFDDNSRGQRCLFTDEYLQMAGRAGRRGIDKVGTVLYLPQRKPAFPEEVKGMMSGSTRAIQSRMDFHYDFLLKTMQSGELRWLSILKDSYWYKQRMVIRDMLVKEQKILEDDVVKTRGLISETDYAELKERADLEEQIKTSVNAKKKAAQKRLVTWQAAHEGPRWTSAWQLLPQLMRLEQAVESKKADIASCEEISSTVEPRLQFLVEAGFLKDVTDATTISKENLTLRGILATEVNESHSLLTAEVYVQDLMKDFDAELILCVLAAFVNEKMDSGAALTVEQLRVPQKIKDMLYTIDGVAKKFQEIESACGIPYDNYWDLNTAWIEPLWRWLQGDTAPYLCLNYGMYEGNLTRTILRMGNIADEWIALATYCEHTEMVQRMTTIKEKLLREIVISDSLYLRV
uniref:Helicase n=1 Tax=viral metagenome TaxID=1070528 RepID=A0A6C0L0U8_9ZZZZ